MTSVAPSSTVFSARVCSAAVCVATGLVSLDDRGAECQLNVHKRCEASVPHRCGQDHTERRGRIHVDLAYSQTTPALGSLVVTIHEAKNIPPMDPNGLADPYVKLKLFPDEDKHDTKKKTATIKCNLNPVFNEQFK